MGLTVKELVTKWGFNIDNKALEQMDSNISKLKSSVAALGAVAVAGAGVLFGLAKSVADAGDDAIKTGREFGLTAERIQEFQFAASIGGVAAKALTASFRKFARGAAEAQDGVAEYAEAFQELNIELEDGEGNLKSIDELVLDSADAFKNMPPGIRKSALALDLFGRTGTRLLNVLNLGREGIEALATEARESGFVIGTEGALASEEFNDSMFRLISVVKGFRNILGLELIPTFTEWFTVTRKMILANRDIIKTKLLDFIRGLLKLTQQVIAVFKTMFRFVNRLVKIFGGWERAILVVASAFALFSFFNIILGLSGIALAAIKIVAAFKALGLAAIIAQVKIFAIPLAIGLAVAALALLVEDFVAFVQGKNSVFDVLEKKFSRISEAAQKAFSIITAPFRLMISSIRTAIDLLDIFRGKLKFQDFVDRHGKRLANAFSGGDAGEFSLRSTLGLQGIGPSTAPVSRARGGASGSFAISVGDITIEVPGEGDPLATGRAAGEAVNNAFDGILRQAGRDFEPILQR